MSGKGNCFDNAPMESFWGTLKQELVHHRHYRSRQEAIRDITEYIEIFYNRQRRQAGIPVTCGLSTKILCRITRSMKGLVSTIAIRPQSSAPTERSDLKREMTFAGPNRRTAGANRNTGRAFRATVIGSDCGFVAADQLQTSDNCL
jgi:hypothetical protein